MTALDTLNHFKTQAETELNALQRKCDATARENKELRTEIEQQRTTVREMSRAAREYAEEMRAKASQATESEIAMRARLICAHDELQRTAEFFREQAEMLKVPIRVLSEHGFILEGVNPSKVIRGLRDEMKRKVKLLRKFYEVKHG